MRSGSIRKRFVRELADRWHETAVAEPFRLPNGVNWLRSGGESDRYPQPGYVGPLYESGGVLLLAMNPGGGGEKDTEHDELYFRSLRGIRENPDRVAAYAEWSRVFANVAVTWKYYWNLIWPILTKLNMDLTQVSYLNILKWRNRPEANSRRLQLYDLSWASQTCAEVELLNPSHIVALGIGAGKWLVRKYGGNAQLHIIPRVRGDHYVAPRTRKAIVELSFGMGVTVSAG